MPRRHRSVPEAVPWVGYGRAVTDTPSAPPTSPSDLPGFDRDVLHGTYTEIGPDRVVLQWSVAPHLLQPYGIVHGGVFCAAVEGAASVGAATWFGERGQVVGVSNHTDFLRATRGGELTATATPVHRGRTQQLWQVEVTDADDRLVARGQVRLQNLTSVPGAGAGADTGQ